LIFGKKKRLPAAGTTAPEFTLPLLNGGEASLGQIISGREALLAFFKISCPVCQLTLPYLERIHSAGAISIYGVSQNDATDTFDFVRDYNLSFPTLLDPEKTFPVSNAYGISSVPTMFLVEPSGLIARVIEGWRKAEMLWLSAHAQAGSLFTQQDRVPEWKAG
jgi:peroxiredoxin